MGNIGSIDMMFLDDVFGMGGGYVLNFSDRTFSEFFREELRIDIDDPLYARNGGPKAKRLRCFLQTVDKPTVARTLDSLWSYRDALQQRSGKPDNVQSLCVEGIRKTGATTFVVEKQDFTPTQDLRLLIVSGLEP